MSSPFLPVFLLPDDENARRQWEKLRKWGPAFMQTLGEALRKRFWEVHPGEAAANLVRASIGGPIRLAWDTIKGTFDIAKSVGAGIIGRPDLPQFHPEQFEYRAEKMAEVLDGLTAGFASRLPEYFDEFVANHHDLKSPSQRALAFAYYTIFQAPVDAAAHIFGGGAEQAVRQLDEGDVSGSVSTVGMLGLTALGVVSGLRPASGSRVLQRTLERKGLASEAISIADIKRAEEFRKARSLGLNVPKGIDLLQDDVSVLDALSMTRNGLPVSVLEQAAGKDNLNRLVNLGLIEVDGNVARVAADGRTAPYAHRLEDFELSDVLDNVKSASELQERVRNRLSEITGVQPADIARIRPGRKVYLPDVREVLDGLIEFEKEGKPLPTGEFPIDEAIKYLVERKGLSMAKVERVLPRLRAEGLIEMVRAPEGETGGWSELPGRNWIAFKIPEAAHKPMAPIEMMKRLIPVTDVIEIETWRSVMEEITTGRADISTPFFTVAMANPDLPITHQLTELMMKEPKLFTDIFVSAQMIDPENAHLYVQAFAEVVRDSSTKAGQILEVSARFANHIRALAEGENLILQKLQDMPLEPPGSAIIGFQWLKRQYKDMLRDVVHKNTLQAAEKRRRHLMKHKKEVASFIRSSLAGKVPDEMLEPLSRDASLQTVARFRGLPPEVISAEQALKLAEDVAAGKVPDIEMPRLVLTEDPFPDLPIDAVPDVLKPAVARLRTIIANSGGGDGGRYIADVSGELRILDKYVTFNQAAADQIAARLVRGAGDDTTNVFVSMGKAASGLWATMEQARASFALANPRTGVRDLINTIAMSQFMMLDKVMAAAIEHLLPGPRVSTYALAEMLSHMLHVRRFRETIEKAGELLEAFPRLSQEFRSVAVPIELIESLQQNYLVRHELPMKISDAVAKGAVTVNALRTFIDRSIRNVLFSHFLTYELAKRGFRHVADGNIIDEAMAAIGNTKLEPVVKEAVVEAMRQAAEASMAANPVPPETIKRALNTEAIQKDLQQALRTEDISVVHGSINNFYWKFLNFFREFPPARTLITMYPRFLVNLWSTLMAHHPANVAAILSPRYRELLHSPDPALRAEAIEHLARGLSGAAVLVGAFWTYRNHSMGKPYLLELQDEDGKYVQVDTRMYRPLDTYLSLAALFDYALTGKRPNLNANEYFDLLTSLRRMTDQPFSALYPWLEQMASGNEEASRNLGAKIIAQYYGPLVVPMAAIADLWNAVGWLAGADWAEDWYRQVDVGTSPIVSPIARVSQPFANWLSQTIGGDPHYATPVKVDPFTGQGSPTGDPLTFFLTGLPAHEVSNLERAFLKAGVDPVQALDPTQQSTPYANLYRKVLGLLLEAPITDPTMPHDLERALQSGMSERSTASIYRITSELVQKGGLSKEAMAADGVAHIRLHDVQTALRFNPTAIVTMMRVSFLNPVYGPEEARRYVASHRTVGDLAAAIILDDKVADKFRIANPVRPEERLSRDEARRYVARTIADMLKGRVGSSTDLIAESIKYAAPWLMTEHIYDRMPKELRERSSPGMIRDLARMPKTEIYKVLEIAGKMDNPTAARILGGKQ